MFGLCPDSLKTFGKALVIVITVLSFKGTTQAHSQKISITHNKEQVLLLNSLINCISAKSARQILYTKDECTFPLSNFKIIGLCNYLASSFVDIFSFSVPLRETDLSHIAKASDSASQEDFLSKNL